jgi:hypothetical protein
MPESMGRIVIAVLKLQRGVSVDAQPTDFLLPDSFHTEFPTHAGFE